MRRLLLILGSIALLTTGVSAATPSLVYIHTATEEGAAFTGSGVPLVAEIPGGFLALLGADEIARLSGWGTSFDVLASDDPTTDVLVKYDMDHGHRTTALPSTVDVLYRGEGFTVLRLPHDDDAALSCLPDIQRVFRRPMRFVTRPWEERPARATREADPAIQAMVATVEDSWVLDQVQTLEDFGTRHSQYTGGELASYWLRDQFLSYGYADVTLHDYNSWNDNVVCIKPGTAFPDKYVVIGAHYDSINPSNNADAPGADDNATGTACVLAAARAMADAEFEYTVVFIAFSGEEQGLYGSEAWASEAADAGLDVVGAVAIDMLGYRASGDAADIDIVFNGASAPIRDMVDEAVADYVPDHVAVDGSIPGGASSDHASFWSNGFRAVLFFEDSGNYSPYIHTANDVIGTSVNDVAFMGQNVRTAVATLALLARPFRIAVSHEPLVHTEELGPFDVTATIVAAADLDPAALQLHYRIAGGEFTTVALASTGNPDEFAATIPAQAAGAPVEYFLSAGDVLANIATSPADAPTALHAFRAGVEMVLVDNVETDQGWEAGLLDDTASTGRWTRADPVGTTYQPEDDHTPDPGVLCFVTGNGAPGAPAGDQDVDGGTTTLLSPIFDLTDISWAEISYWRYYVLETSYDDEFRVDLSTDGGATWSNLEVVTGTTGWTQARFELEPTSPARSQMQLRFQATDTGDGSLVEALIDDVMIVAVRDDLTPVDDTPAVETNLAAYPNPFNPQTTLQYALPRAGRAELRVFDAAGRLVATPLLDSRPAGAGEVAWNAESLASGPYLVQLRLDGEVLRATKLMLVR